MIYLDFNATTPLLPAAAEEMSRVQHDYPGNAFSIQHQIGRAASAVVREASARAAESLAVPAPDLVWTAGATESLRWAIIGNVLASSPSRRTVVISAAEHKAALDAAKFSERFLGATIKLVPPSADGLTDPRVVAETIDSHTCLAVFMLANNETGVVTQIEEVARLCAAADVPLLCDVTQAVGKLDLTTIVNLVDISVCSAHKFYGPKGVGLLVADRDMRRRIASALPGGESSGLTSGTPNHIGIAGASVALAAAVGSLNENARHCGQLITDLVRLLREGFPESRVVSGDVERICNTVNVRFPGADAEAIMARTPHIALATGSACNSGFPEPSHVLAAMGLSPREAEECLRFSVGAPSTADEVVLAAKLVAEAAAQVRSFAEV